MANETDADRIQREKDRRRAEERLHIAREHHRRLHDVETLRRSPTGAIPDGPVRTLSASTSGPVEENARANPPPGPVQAKQEVPREAPVRPIGRPIRSEALRNFLLLDPAEQFDIQGLNRIPFGPLLQDGGEDPELLELLAQRSEVLMERVKREVDDPLSAGALLREFALTWYRSSPADPQWGQLAPDRWGGVFAESKVSGGRLHPWLNMRLWAVHQRAIRDGRVVRRFRRGLSRSRVAEASVSRTPSQQIQAEVAQAFADDLAARPRQPDAAFPLVRLSELAARRQVATVNDALGALFSSSESGPFVVLHPNRYPDCDELQIRPPAGAASGAALAFTLVTPKGSRRPVAHPSGSGHPDASTAEPLEEALDGSTVWEASAASAAAWRSVIEDSRREKRRLDAPPRDYRSRAPYSSLRELLLEDAELRKAFLAVKWRGRPAGLPLLVSLLQKGTISPEVATDHEYLEAELGELSQGDPHFVPEGGTWTFAGWTVTRTGSHREGFRYEATSTSPGKG